MNIRTVIFFLLIAIMVAGCAPTANATLSPQSSSPTDTQIPSETSDPGSMVPENTPYSATPTFPSVDEIPLLTNESPDVVLTAMNLQLENEQMQLTLSAEEIATLNSQISALETAVVNAENSNNSSSSSSGGSSGGSSTEYEIPSNVYTIVTVRKASLYVVGEYNSNNAPVMVPYEPRVYLEAGTNTWVYKSQVKADGGAIFYESYDPDGEVSEKFYFYAKEIQIRLPDGSPNPDNYPDNYVRVGFTEHTVLFVPVTYDDKDKPVMDSYKPIIAYEVGDYEVIDPQYVIATGGSHFYPVYDGDGSPSGYLWSKFITFPLFWD